MLNQVNNCINKINIFNLILLLLFFQTHKVLAECRVNKLPGSFSKIIVNPYQESIISNFPESGVSIRQCDPDITKLIISKNTSFQFLTTSQQSLNLSSDLANLEKCLIKKDESLVSHLDTTTNEISLVKENVSQDLEFLNKCVLFEITSQNRLPLNLSENELCKIQTLSDDKTRIIAQGSQCVLDFKATSSVAVNFKISSECQKNNFYKNFQPRDILSQFIVHPARIDKEKSLKAGIEVFRGDSAGPTFSRTILFKVLPSPQKFPTTMDEVSKINYPSVLNYNFIPAQMQFRQFGSKYKFEPSLYVENISQYFCYNGQCNRGSNFISPVVVKISLSKKINGRYQVLHDKDWYAAINIPKNFKGVVDLNDRSSFFTNLANQYYIDQNIQAGDTLRLKYEFYEPKSMLDLISLDDIYSDLKSTVDGNESPDDLKLPMLSKLSFNTKIGELARVSLASDNSHLDLENIGVDLKSSFTHNYNYICNQANKCNPLKPTESFQTIIVDFDIDQFEYGVSKLKNFEVYSKSPTFTDYSYKPQFLVNYQCQ